MLSLLAINPIAFQFGPFSIHWYGIMYILGFAFCFAYFTYYFLPRFKAPFKEDDLNDIIFYVFLGILIGGRLGYVLMYNLPYFIEHPSHIPAIWEGGLSFHGGLLGVVGYLTYYCKKKGYAPLSFADHIVLPIPIAIGLGRLGNFINGELWGKVSPDNRWCMVFPAADLQCRYPTQLIEGFFEGIVLFALLHLLLYCTKYLSQPGKIFGSFLIGYGIIRFLIEYIREPDRQLGLLWNIISMGQLLSLPLILIGIILFFHHDFTHRKTRASSHITH